MPSQPSSARAPPAQDHPFAARPIPILDPSLSTLGRTAIPVDLSDPRSRERLVDVRDLGVEGENFYAKTDGSNPPYKVRIDGAISDLLLRQGAAERLARADAGLRQAGLRFFVFDAYRPIPTQTGLWDFFYRHFEQTQPSLGPGELEAITLRFVADPRSFDPADSRTWPLHATGGAVDLALMDGAGMLEFGTPFDDPTEQAGTGFFEALALAGEIAPGDPRLINRRILYWTMIEAGFTNYLHEWWHYDYGDQMHVFTLGLLGRPLAGGQAWYGYTEPPAAS